MSAAYGAEEPGGPDGDLPAAPGSGARREWAAVSGDAVPCAADSRDRACAGEAAAAGAWGTPPRAPPGGPCAGPAGHRATPARGEPPPILAQPRDGGRWRV